MLKPISGFVPLIISLPLCHKSKSNINALSIILVIDKKLSYTFYELW